VRDLRLGALAGLTITAAPSALIGLPLLWLGLSALAYFWLRLPPLPALGGGLLAVALHLLGELIHQLGHARAARATGHPMTGVRLWWILGASVYPPDEGELPGPVHVRRALGGPAVSAVATVAAILVAWALYPLGGLPRYLSLFVALEGVFLYSLGALVPVGFTDGSTLLRWWGKP
jgi:hypothetical protein